MKKHVRLKHIVVPIREGEDDIEEGFPAMLRNEGEALLRYCKADEDDLSEEKSNASASSLHNSSSIGADSSISWGADVVISSHSGIADDESSNGKEVSKSEHCLSS